MKGTGGFTLTELLVLAGIAAISAIMLLPVLSRANAEDGAAQCKNNLRLIGQAEQMYAEDFGGAGVPGHHHHDTSHKGLNALATQGYLPSRPNDTYVCPSWPPHTDDGSRWGMYGTVQFRGSANFNPYTIDTGSHSYDMFIMLSEIDHPSHFPRHADSYESREDSGRFGKQATWLLWDSSNRATFHLRHGGGCNMVFADGHVETAGPDRITESLSYSLYTGEYRAYWLEVEDDDPAVRKNRVVEGRIPR